MSVSSQYNWKNLNRFQKGVLILSAAITFMFIGNMSKSTAAQNNNEVKSVMTTQNVITKKQITVNEKVAYKTIEQDDFTLNKGETKTNNEGIEGTKKVTYEVMYKDGLEISHAEVKSEVVTEPIDKVVRVGAYVATPLPVTSYNVPTQDGAYYANCTAAREAGVTPIYQGEAGYQPALDRDNNGVACEQ